MRSVGIAPNPHKTEAVQLAAELAKWLAARGVEALLPAEVADKAADHARSASDDQLSRAEIVVVLGGDGTMLRWARLAAPLGTPMLGVNFGQYGFITEVHPDEAKTAISSVLEGNYFLSERVVLEATLTRDGVTIGTYQALNDVVVSKGPIGRMLGLHTWINGKFIVTYAADGLIVATPTGSTAYSLSAGGPVVHPAVNVFIITPICPHTLSARSLVVQDTERVQIVGECGEGDEAMMLTIDGQLGENLQCRDVVEVCTADFTAKLVQLGPQTFYDKLQTRLRWGERISGS